MTPWLTQRHLHLVQPSSHSPIHTALCMHPVKQCQWRRLKQDAQTCELHHDYHVHDQEQVWRCGWVVIHASKSWLRKSSHSCLTTI